jgi:hypothetical protein
VKPQSENNNFRVVYTHSSDYFLHLWNATSWFLSYYSQAVHAREVFDHCVIWRAGGDFRSGDEFDQEFFSAWLNEINRFLVNSVGTKQLYADIRAKFMNRVTEQWCRCKVS